jgi:hypothetical protein
VGGSTSKKVQIARFDRESLTGFVNQATFLTSRGVELLSLSGNASVVPYQEIKAVHFVKDFEPGEVHLTRREFLTRPKMDGLWVWLRFRDRETLEAVLPNNLLQLDQYGFTVIPPDFSYNNQRLFVPRTALVELQVLGVVGSPIQKEKRRAKAIPKEQIRLFE